MHHELICFLYACYSKSLLLFLLGSLLDVCGVGAAPLRPPLGDVQGTCSRFKRRASWPFKAEGRPWQIKQAIIVLRWAHEGVARSLTIRNQLGRRDASAAAPLKASLE